MRGCFFALEGIDGSGKSTQLPLLARRLEEAGFPCLQTREPTDGPVGSLLRRVLTGQVTCDSRVAAPLFVADRLDHLLRPEDGLLAVLEGGTTVLCDRYLFSSYAYQSVDLSLDWVIGANRPCADLLRPDATLFLDVEPELALARSGFNHQDLNIRLELGSTQAIKQAVRCHMGVAVISALTVQEECRLRQMTGITSYL